MKIKTCKAPVAKFDYKGRRYVCCLNRKKRPVCRQQPCAKPGGTPRFDAALLGLKRKKSRKSRK